MKHLSSAEIESRLDEVLASPKDGGTLELIVRRPRTDEREELERGELDAELGLLGDSWAEQRRGAETQIAIMNSRMVSIIARDDARRSLAGDQLYVDLDLSEENLPHGTRLAVGGAILETTAKAHKGCRKFVDRFGLDAMIFVNSPTGKRHNLRGIYAKVVRSGPITRGDRIVKL